MMSTTTNDTKRDQAVAALRLILDGIVDAVTACEPIGAPGGVIFAALMAQGCTLAQYQHLMGALVRAGKLTRDGDLYHLATPAVATTEAV